MQHGSISRTRTFSGLIRSSKSSRTIIRLLLVAVHVFVLAIAPVGYCSAQSVIDDFDYRFERDFLPFVVLYYWRIRNDLEQGQGEYLDSLLSQLRNLDTKMHLDAIRELADKTDSPVEFAYAIIELGHDGMTNDASRSNE